MSTESKTVELVGEFPIVQMGHGKVEVAIGTQDDYEALIIGRNGSGAIGGSTQPERVHLPGETIVVFTFTNSDPLKNAAAIDVMIGKLRELRSRFIPEFTTAA